MFAMTACPSSEHAQTLQALMALMAHNPGRKPLTGDFLCRFVSKAGAGSRGGGDRQFCYVNGRPVDLPKVSSATHACYTPCTMQQV